MIVRDVHGTAFIGMDKGVDNKRFMLLGKKRHVPSFDTLEFEAHFHSYLTEDELGDMVDVPYMYGTAKKTSQMERSVNREIAKQDDLNQKIIQIVGQFNAAGSPINRTNLRQRLGGSASLAGEAIDKLILNKVIEEYEHPNKTNNRQKLALRLTCISDFDI